MKWNRIFNFIMNTCLSLLLFIFSFGICSCVETQPRQQEKSVTQQVYEEVIEQVEERVLSDQWMEKRIQKKWYEGHEYLVMDGGYAPAPVGYNKIYTFQHNPNCPCFNEE